jgi:deoxyribodipyrimidine photo-lyase
VLPLFIADDELLGPAGPARVALLAESLRALERSMGSPLCLRAGRPATVLGRLVAETGARQVLVTADHAPYGRRRDAEVAESLGGLGAELIERGSNYAVEPGTLCSEKGQPLKVFSAFRRRWEQLGPSPVLPEPDCRWASATSELDLDQLIERGSTRRPRLFADLPDGPPTELPTAGEAAAAASLEDFRGRAAAYSDTRDQLAQPGTSQLSWHLRFGTIHPRRVLTAVAGVDGGAAAFCSEICWREFYADLLFHAPWSARSSLQPSLASLRWDQGPLAEERFRSWALGETGFPLVDAAMRQLLATGWMHNRARMVAASFLVKHLHLDWRWGARWFMWRLVDGDLASNTHGWQWTAGTGTDAAPFHRIFSPTAQAERFDPEAAYVHRWVPELSSTPAPAALRPGGGEGLLRPPGYPEPIVDLAAERAEALVRFAEARGRSRQDL